MPSEPRREDETMSTEQERLIEAIWRVNREFHGLIRITVEGPADEPSPIERVAQALLAIGVRPPAVLPPTQSERDQATVRKIHRDLTLLTPSELYAATLELLDTP